MVSWLKASTSHERGPLYYSFVEHCVKYLDKLANTLDDWYLFHKNNSDQYVL
jgi:hypothetical protein